MHPTRLYSDHCLLVHILHYGILPSLPGLENLTPLLVYLSGYIPRPQQYPLKEILKKKTTRITHNYHPTRSTDRPNLNPHQHRKRPRALHTCDFVESLRGVLRRYDGGIPGRRQFKIIKIFIRDAGTFNEHGLIMEIYLFYC